MKSVLTLLAALVVLSTPALADTGIGIQFGHPGNVGLSFRSNNLAAAASWGTGDGGYLHITADLWMMKNQLSNNLDWYLGPGVDVGLNDPFFLALRVPVGLQFMASKKFEIFGELAPGLQVLKDLNFYIAGAVGVRYIL